MKIEIFKAGLIDTDSSSQQNIKEICSHSSSQNS